MPLELAIRPRIRLDRPLPARRRLRLRLPPLALPIVAYWLGMAVLTQALRATLAEESPEERAPVRTASMADEALEEAGPPDPEPEAEPEPPPPAVVPPPAPALAIATVTAEPTSAAAAPPSRERVAPPAELPLAPPPERRPAVARAAQRSPEPPDPFAALESVSSRRSDAPRRTEAPATTPAVEPPSAPPPATSLPSCETAAAAANDTFDLRAAPGAPDLTRDAFASVLENGAYLARCSVPPRTALEICAAVQDGKVVGVSVTSSPRDSAVNACVRRSVAALRFPANARLDVTRTRFEPAR